jgi:hypothetical protein
MERLRIDLDNPHSVGLGDNLCLLSALTTIKPTVDLYVSNDHNAYEKFKWFKKILRLPDSQITVSHRDGNGDFNAGGYWPIKLFTDYYKPLHVCVNGKELRTRHDKEKEKRYIGVAGFWATDPDGKNIWPYCKSRPMDYWLKIFKWIKEIGYEVITLDNAGNNLENKIELMVNHCRGVISYEGGMAHLSHMLNIPCFMVDWKFPTPSTPFQGYHCDLVHMTNSVYILRDDEEIFSWGEGDFNRMCDALKQGQTNNRFINKECKIKFDGPGKRGDLKILDKNDQLLLSTGSMFGKTNLTTFVETYF